MTFIGATEEKAGMRGRKSNKARITLLVGCAPDGTKQELICIGAAANLRWPVLLGNRGQAKASVTYFSSKKGWMTRDIFCKIMHQIENRKQFILLDNCSAHTSFENTYDGEKTFTKVLFLPKNCTSKIQPLDQGITRSIKAHYKARLQGLF